MLTMRFAFLPGGSRCAHSVTTSKIDKLVRDDRISVVREEEISMITGQGVLWVSYHQIWLSGPTGRPEPAEMIFNGPGSFVELYSEAVLIHTGISTGDVGVAVTQLSGPPAEVDSTLRWEDIVEFSLGDEAEPPIYIGALEGSPDGDVPAVAERDWTGGTRVRVHGRGRDIAYDGVCEADPWEDYLIQCWPAPGAAEQVLLASDVRAGFGIKLAPASYRHHEPDPGKYHTGPPQSMPAFEAITPVEPSRLADTLRRSRERDAENAFPDRPSAHPRKRAFDRTGQTQTTTNAADMRLRSNRGGSRVADDHQPTGRHPQSAGPDTFADDEPDQGHRRTLGRTFGPTTHGAVAVPGRAVGTSVEVRAVADRLEWIMSPSEATRTTIAPSRGDRPLGRVGIDARARADEKVRSRWPRGVRTIDSRC
jgi:hypothetical protein